MRFVRVSQTVHSQETRPAILLAHVQQPRIAACVPREAKGNRVITVNLLTPKVPFAFPVTYYRTRFPQTEPPSKHPRFPQTLFSSTLRERVEGALLWELVRLFDSG